MGVYIWGIYISEYSQKEKVQFRFLDNLNFMKSCVFIIFKTFKFFIENLQFLKSRLFAIFHYMGNENE